MNKRTISQTLGVTPVKQLEDDLLLMKAGREQDRNELAICVNALFTIATGKKYMERSLMIEHARQALVNIGALAGKRTTRGKVT